MWRTEGRKASRDKWFCFMICSLVIKHVYDSKEKRKKCYVDHSLVHALLSNSVRSILTEGEKRKSTQLFIIMSLPMLLMWYELCAWGICWLSSDKTEHFILLKDRLASIKKSLCLLKMVIIIMMPFTAELRRRFWHGNSTCGFKWAFLAIQSRGRRSRKHSFMSYTHLI